VSRFGDGEQVRVLGSTVPAFSATRFVCSFLLYLLIWFVCDVVNLAWTWTSSVIVYFSVCDYELSIPMLAARLYEFSKKSIYKNCRSICYEESI